MCFALGFAQSENKNELTISTVTSFGIKVDDVSQFKTINWDDIKDVFQTNKPEDAIEITIEMDFPETGKIKGNSSMTVGGKTKDLDNLITRAKKVTKKFEKIINNLNK